MRRWGNQSSKDEGKSVWNIHGMFQSSKNNSFRSSLNTSIDQVSAVKKVVTNVRSSVIDALNPKVTHAR